MDQLTLENLLREIHLLVQDQVFQEYFGLLDLEKEQQELFAEIDLLLNAQNAARPQSRPFNPFMYSMNGLLIKPTNNADNFSHRHLAEVVAQTTFALTEYGKNTIEKCKTNDETATAQYNA
jgi:hypothetical protein